MPVVDDYTAILSGSSWTGNDYSTGKPVFLTFSFDTAPASYLADEGNHSQAFIDSFRAYNSSEKAAARAALAVWADASGVTFLEVAAGKGDIRFGSYDFSRDP
ncbi:MAG TPA: hypothetical protein VK968_09920, partial [Roseimicrobium sp.]|nr:hypothetical protein [Roseimicrobium sp.]